MWRRDLTARITKENNEAVAVGKIRENEPPLQGIGHAASEILRIRKQLVRMQTKIDNVEKSVGVAHGCKYA